MKSAGHGGNVGAAAAKQIKGRKRPLLVDTLGLVRGVAGTPASTPEREGAAPDGRVLDAVSSDENSWFSIEIRSRSYAKC